MLIAVLPERLNKARKRLIGVEQSVQASVTDQTEEVSRAGRPRCSRANLCWGLFKRVFSTLIILRRLSGSRGLYL